MKAARTSESNARPPELASRIGYLLKHAQQRFHSIQDEALLPIGLDGRLLAVLIVAAEQAQALQLRLAERLGIDRTTMVALVDRLEQLGFVERHTDPSDRRARLVQLTPPGKQALADGLAASVRVERAFLASLPRSDRAAFREMLRRVSDPSP